MKKRLIVLSSIAAVLSAGVAYFFATFSFIPRPASLERDSIDSVVQLVFAISAVFVVIIVVVLTDSLIFFRRRPGETGDGPPIKGSPRLEQAWTLVPLAIVVALAAYGGIVLHDMEKPAPSAEAELRVDVLSFRFGWQFTYPEYNIKSFDLRLPVGRRVLLRLESSDVVHAFWVKEFGPKQDAVPGMTTEMRVTPTKIGQYLVECSQLCGWGHTYMTAPAYVTSDADFQKWVQEQQAKQRQAAQ